MRNISKSSMVEFILEKNYPSSRIIRLKPAFHIGDILRFRVFIGQQNFVRSGNSKIPDRLGFSRHMKTRLKYKSQDEF